MFSRLIRAFGGSARDVSNDPESRPLLGSSQKGYDEEQSIESREASQLSRPDQLVIHHQGNGTIEVAQRVGVIPAPATISEPLPPPPGGFMIFVKSLNGSSVLIPVHESDTVDDLKEKIRNKLGILPRAQRLIFRGQRLADDAVLGRYGIEKDSTLHLVLTLRGGGDVSRGTELTQLSTILPGHPVPQQQPGTVKRDRLRLITSWTRSREEDGSVLRRIFEQLRMILFSSWQHVFLLAIPAGFVMRYAEYQSPAIFAVNFLAVIPSAFNIEEATFSLAMHVNETVGGLITMSLDNVVQLVASVLLLRSNQVPVLKTSLIGTILSNVLLMSGLSFLAGGIARSEQTFNPKRAQVWGTILLLIITSLLIPTVSHALNVSDPEGVLVQSRGSSVLLLGSYGLYGLYCLWTHRDVADGDTNDGQTDSSAAAEGDGDPPYLALPAAVLTLGVFGTLLGFNMQLAADSLQSLLETTALTPTFVGLVIMPLLNFNHLPLLTAYKNRVDLSLDLTVSKSIQTALVVVPLTVLISWGMGTTEMTLLFSGFEVTCLFVAVLVVSQVVGSGRSDWLQGALMVQAYVVISVASFFVP
ncbi:ubiquitin-domain-containing protein [Xylariomycetidae sp. FL2044]|nr:ubiquitin-domain-containing protein [Xylariomycetidae sp. FL2044]